jgi:hypothetical protein
VTGGRVRVRRWPEHTDQAGDELRTIVSLMGADVDRDGEDLVVSGGGSIEGISADLHHVGELTPVIAALCALAGSTSHLSGVAHLRGHETDRLAAISTEINRLGGRVTELPDGLRIEPAPLHGGTFATYSDHRMAHAGTVLGLAVAGYRWRTSRPRRRPSRASSWSGAGSSGEPALRRDRPRALRAPAPAHASPHQGPAAHADAVLARVTTIDRGRYTLLIDDRIVTAMTARQLGRKAVVVGDWVRVVATSAATPARCRGSSGWSRGPPRCGAPPTTMTRWSGSSCPTPSSWSWSPRWPTLLRGRG